MTQVICDEVLQWAAAYDGPPFHVLLTDAPYELGFMGRSWDQSGIAFRPDTWHALARHLFPGGFIVAFGSSRGYHRLACAMEDAGLIIHPALGWVQASGWPKATRIDTQVDAEAGVERELAGYHDTRGDFDGCSRQSSALNTSPATPLSAQWTGHRYGLQALKPAIEFIAVAQVPYVGRPFACITRTGAGAYWIEGTRVSGPLPHHNYGRTSGPESMPGPSDMPFNTPSSGRWPANFALCHLPDCHPQGIAQISGDPRGDCAGTRPSGFGNVGAPNGTGEPNAHVYGEETIQTWQCAPGCPVNAINIQAGIKTSNSGAAFRRSPDNERNTYGRCNGNNAEGFYGDTGPASRFFPCFGWSLDIAEHLAAASPVEYCPKASRTERNAGLSGRNMHPTIKPLALCQWLATLFLPPGQYAPRRLLVPFCGTGSEMIGAMRAGWEDIVGIEQDADSVATAQQRIGWWTTQHQLMTQQLPLFTRGV